MRGRVGKLGARDLARIERELERIGLLLRHDVLLPSFTGLAVGAPFRGSWWAHPRTHEIYDLMQCFHDGAGALSVKLVDGKLTYVHRRLWPALLDAVRGSAGWQREGLSPAARALLGLVRRRGALPSDELPPARGARPGAPIEELERRLLVHTGDVHTETGAHRKRLESWSHWCAQSGQRFPRGPAARGRAELERAVDALAAGTGASPRLPWPRPGGGALSAGAGSRGSSAGPRRAAPR
jgi:hypothetical protein